MTTSGLVLTWALEILNLSGGMYIIDGFKEEPKVLEFYFADCPACNQNAPNVKELAREFHNKGAQVLDITIDCDPKDHEKWIRRHNPEHPVLNSCEPDISQDYGVSAFPTTIILDKNNRVIKKYTGVWSNSKKQEIKRIIQAQSEQ